MPQRVDEASKAGVHAKECALQISFITAQIPQAAGALEFDFVRFAAVQIFRSGCGRKAQLGGKI